MFDEGSTDEDSGLIVYTCTICERKKTQDLGIIIVISGGTATLEGKEVTILNTKKFGESAIAYIVQENDVLNVKLTDQDGRTFRH